MTERLQKYLARAGVASRRLAEKLIAEGRVQVNNAAVTEMGTKVEAGKDLVTVDGKLVDPPAARSYFAFYKPPSVVTTLSDPQGRPTVGDFAREVGTRVFPVGRLDYDAEGALLLTDDGELAHKLLHPSFQVPRTYLAKVKGVPTEETLAKLRGGVRLEDGMATPTQVQLFEKAEKNTWVKIVVAEGRQHLIKRLCAAVGHPVVRLFRPSYAGVTVHGMKPGELRPLSSQEVQRLEAVSRGEAVPEEGQLNLPARRHGHGVAADEAAAEEAAARAEMGEDEAPEEAGTVEGGEEADVAPAEDAGQELPGGSETESFGAPKPVDRGGGRKPFGGTRKGGAGGGRKPFGGTMKGGAGGGRKPFGGPRKFGEGGERKSFAGPRKFGEGGERKSFGGPRKFAEGGERKSFGGPRKFGEGGERKSFGGPRKFGEGGERKSFGGPRKFGEGGERKSFGGPKRFGAPQRGGPSSRGGGKSGPPRR